MDYKQELSYLQDALNTIKGIQKHRGKDVYRDYCKAIKIDLETKKDESTNDAFKEKLENLIVLVDSAQDNPEILKRLHENKK